MNNFLKVNLNNLLNYKSVDFKSCVSAPEPFRAAPHDELFKTECVPGANESYEFNGVPFVFPQYSNEGYDNICLEGQLINIDTGNFTKIHIVGFCEGEGFTETFTFISPDGTENSSEIFLYNSWKGIEHWSHERNPEMCKDVFLTATVTNSPRGIFYNSDIFENMIISGIKLPFNPCMHIFSITLES